MLDGPAKPAREEAVASLFHACYRQLVRTAFGLVGDWDVAEEIAQEAFLRLWRRWRWIRDPAAAPAYLNRTVVNLAYTIGSRRALERAAMVEKADRAGADAIGDAEVRHALAILSPRKRACIVLRYLVGLTEAETAEVLGVTPGTVKSQTHKALRSLRQHLADPGPQSARAEGPAGSRITQKGRRT